MSTRRRLAISDTPYKPAYVVWELTLLCDQPCLHCGSHPEMRAPRSSRPSRRLASSPS